MNNVAINRIKKRSNNILGVINFIKWGTAILLLVFIGLLFWASFLPQESFNAEKGIHNWGVSINLIKDGLFYSVSIPFRVLQQGPYMFQAKTAFITYTLFNTVPFMLVLLYGINQVKHILSSITDTHTPFANQNAKRFKNIAIVIIGYSLLGDLIVNFANVIFVTGIFSIILTNINLSGLIIGFLLLIVSQIFRYGAYLQEEFDTTL